MTRVLMLTSTLPRHLGDHQANFVGEQAEAWAQARPDDRITILAPHHLGAALSERAGAVEIRRFRYVRPERWQALAYPAIMPNLKRNFWLAWQILPFLICQFIAALRILRRARADLVYAHWVFPQGLVAWMLRLTTGTNYVLQNHSSDLAVLSKLGAPGRALARLLLRRSAHFFCVNAEQGEAALALFSGSERVAMARRITVLPMGVRADLTGDHATVSQDIAVGTIGRLSRKKGLDHLIAAAELLAERGIRPRIVIAGDGEERERLQRMVRLADIHFAGFVDGPAKADFLARCSRFAFPAVAVGGDVEGMPVALLEGLARGAPVLASRDTNIALLPEWPDIRSKLEFVENPADVAALSEALERLADRPATPDLRLSALIGRYRWERLIEEYLAQIESTGG